MNSVSSESEGDEQTATQTELQIDTDTQQLSGGHRTPRIFSFSEKKINERKICKAPTNWGDTSKLLKVARPASILPWLPAQTLQSLPDMHNITPELQI